MKYICECCGEEKEDWPAIAYNCPSHYTDLNDEELENTELTSDFCIINNIDGTSDRYIRAVLIQEVIDNCQDLEYGVWVSLSEKSFNEYVENYNVKDFEAKYFGWFSNYLPDYIEEFTINVPTTVVVNNKIGRPFIFPHQSFDHDFVSDFYTGITKEEAERRINVVLNK